MTSAVRNAGVAAPTANKVVKIARKTLINIIVNATAKEDVVQLKRSHGQLVGNGAIARVRRL